MENRHSDRNRICFQVFLQIRNPELDHHQGGGDPGHLGHLHSRHLHGLPLMP